jgi:hypothetical protein
MSRRILSLTLFSCWFCGEVRRGAVAVGVVGEEKEEEEEEEEEAVRGGGQLHGMG